MSTKFEQLLDLLVNEEHDKANELFHEIVVEKSREIYENLIAEEAEVEEELDEESTDEEAENEEVEESFGMDDAEEEPEVGGDATDAFVSSSEDKPEGEEGSEDDTAPATKGDVQDLEDALEELKAEFERLMNAEEAEEEENPGVHGDASLTGADDEEGDEEGEEEGEEDEEFENLQYESRQLTREYREKVATPSMTDGGGVGSGKGDLAGQTGTVNTKSPVSSGAGKPTTSASAKNIAAGGTGEGNNTGTSPNAKGPAGVLKAGGDFVPAGTKNVSSSATAKMPDGAKLSAVSKPAMKKEGQGVGAVAGGDKAGQTGAVDTRSPTDRKF